LAANKVMLATFFLRVTACYRGGGVDMMRFQSTVKWPSLASTV
jgi:hypothetical protein